MYLVEAVLLITGIYDHCANIITMSNPHLPSIYHCRMRLRILQEITQWLVVRGGCMLGSPNKVDHESGTKVNTVFS